MRYFKVVLATFFSVIGAAALCVGIMYLSGFFKPEIVNPESISFEVTEYISDTDFSLLITSPTEGVTEKTVALSLENGETEGEYVTDGVIKVPKNVEIGKEFNVSVVKVQNEEINNELWNKGGHSVLWGKSTHVLTLPTNKVDIYIDVPVYSLDVGFYDINNQDQEILPKIINNAEDEESEEEDDGATQLSATEQTKVLELAIGSMFKVKGEFLPSASRYMAKSGLNKEVLFEIPADYADYLEFQNEERTIVKILGQTANRDVKINAYCFKTTNEQLNNSTKPFQEKLSLMRVVGAAAKSERIFGATVKIAEDNGFSISFDGTIKLAINKPIKLYANKDAADLRDEEMSLGMKVVSDVSGISIQDQVAGVRLKIQEYIGGEYKETESVKFEKDFGYDENEEYGLLANVNINAPNNSYWKIVATQAAVGGRFRIVATLVETVYSAALSDVKIEAHEQEFTNIEIGGIIDGNADWLEGFTQQTDLTIIDQTQTSNKVNPQVDLNSKVVIDNINATYKTVKFFAYCTNAAHNHEEDCDLTEAISCSLYATDHDVPGGEKASIYEIKDGILTCFKEASFNVFYAIVETDYKGNVVFDTSVDYKKYIFKNTSMGVREFNVYKTLQNLNFFISDEQTSNKNEDESTKDYELHFRQQSESPPFKITLYGENKEVFEREYEKENIRICFLDSDDKPTSLFSVNEDPIPYIHATNGVADGWGYTFEVNIGETKEAKDYYISIAYKLNSALGGLVTKSIEFESGFVEETVKVKVLTGLVTSIAFDYETSEDNPVIVSTIISDSTIERVFKFNEETLSIEALSSITIDNDAINKDYSFKSSDTSIISIITGSNSLPSFRVVSPVNDSKVTITATAEDGSDKKAYLHIKVEAGTAVDLYYNNELITSNNGFQLSMDGIVNTMIEFNKFTAKEKDTDEVIGDPLVFSSDISDIDDMSGYVSLNSDAGGIVITNTFGRSAAFHLYASIEMLSYEVSITVTINQGYIFEPPVIISGDVEIVKDVLSGYEYYSCYGKTEISVSAELKIKDVEDVIALESKMFTHQSGIEIQYANKSLTFSFPEVGTTTEYVVVFAYPENNAFALKYYFRFKVRPNIKLGINDTGNTENNPYIYDTNKVLFNTAGTGAVILERISVAQGGVGQGFVDNENTVITINNVSYELEEGDFKFPNLNTNNTIGYEVSINYLGIVLTTLLYVKPNVDLGSIADAKNYIKYNGVSYLKLVSGDADGVELPTGLTYSVGGSSDISLAEDEGGVKTLVAKSGKNEICISGEFSVGNTYGSVNVPVIILPINTLAGSQYFVNYKTAPDPEDLYFALKDHYDEYDGGTSFDLDADFLGENFSKWNYLIINEDPKDETVHATLEECKKNNQRYYKVNIKEVGESTNIRLRVIYREVGDNEYSFDYRINIVANQKFKVRYPYLSGESKSNDDCEYLAFDEKKIVSIDFNEEFDINIPNAIRTENDVEDETPYTYGGKRITLYNGEEIANNTIIHYEIKEIEIGGALIDQSNWSLYATIDKTTAILEIKNTVQDSSDIYVVVRAYTNTGAEAFYRVVAIAETPEYFVEYDNVDITNDSAFEIVLLGGLEGYNTLDLTKFSVFKTTGVTTEKLDVNNYGFRLNSDDSRVAVDSEKIQVDTQFTETYEAKMYIYTKTGEILRINFYVYPLLDYDIVCVNYTGGETINLKDNTHLFKIVDSDSEVIVENEYQICVDGADYVKIGENQYFVNDNKVVVDNESYSVVGGEIFINGTLYSVRKDEIEIGHLKIEELLNTYRQYVLINQIKYYVEDGKVTYGNDVIPVDKNSVAINGTQYFVTKYYSVESSYSNRVLDSDGKEVDSPVFYYNYDNAFNVSDYIKVYDNNGSLIDNSDDYPFSIIGNEIKSDDIGTVVNVKFLDKYINDKLNEELCVGRIKIIPYQMINGGEPRCVDMNQYTDDWLGEDVNTYCTENGELNTTDYIFSLDVEGKDSELISTIEIPYGTEGKVNVYKKNYKYDATEKLKGYYDGDDPINGYIITPSTNCEINIESIGEDGETTYKYYLEHIGDDLSIISVSVKQTSAGGGTVNVATIAHTPTTPEKTFTVGLKNYGDVIEEALTETIDISKYKFYRVGLTPETIIEDSDHIKFLNEEERIELRILLKGKQVGALILYKGESSGNASEFTDKFEHWFKDVTTTAKTTTYKIEKWGETVRVKQKINNAPDADITWKITSGDETILEGEDTLENVTDTGVTKNYHIEVYGKDIVPSTEGNNERFMFDYAINIGINVSIKDQSSSVTNPHSLDSVKALKSVDIELEDYFDVKQGTFNIACQVLKGSDAIDEVGPDNSDSKSVTIKTKQVSRNTEVIVQVDLQTSDDDPKTLLTTYVGFVVIPSVSVVVNHITVGGVTLSPEPVYIKEYPNDETDNGFDLFGTSKVADDKKVARVVITEGCVVWQIADKKNRIKVEVYQDDNKHLRSSETDGTLNIADYNKIKFNAFPSGVTSSDIILNIKVDGVQFAQYHIRLFSDNIYSAMLNTQERTIEDGVEIIPVQGEGKEGILSADSKRFIYKINGVPIANPRDAFTVVDSVGNDIGQSGIYNVDNGKVYIIKNNVDDVAQTVIIQGPGGGNALVYKFKRVWDYQFGESATLSRTNISTADGNKEAFVLYAETSAEARDGDYDLITRFGLKTYEGEYFDGDDTTLSLVYDKSEFNNCVSFTKNAAGNSFIIIAHGADNDGVQAKFTLSPFGDGVGATIDFYVLIMPSIRIEISYSESSIETIFDNKEQEFQPIRESEYTLYDENIRRINVTKRSYDINGNYTVCDASHLTTSLSYTIKDAGDGVIEKVVSNGSVKCNFKIPIFADKYCLLRICDSFGYEVIMGFKVISTTYSQLSVENMTFYTGDEIKWKTRDAFGKETSAESEAQSFPYMFNGYQPIVDNSNSSTTLFLVCYRFEQKGDVTFSAEMSDFYDVDSNQINSGFVLYYKENDPAFVAQQYDFTSRPSLDSTKTYQFAIAEASGYVLSYSCQAGGEDLCGSSNKFNEYGNQVGSPFVKNDILVGQKLKITMTKGTSPNEIKDTLELPITLYLRYMTVITYPTESVLYLPAVSSGINIFKSNDECNDFSSVNNNYGIAGLLDRKTGEYVFEGVTDRDKTISATSVNESAQKDITLTYNGKSYTATLKYKVVEPYHSISVDYGSSTFLSLEYEKGIFELAEWSADVKLKDYYGRVLEGKTLSDGGFLTYSLNYTGNEGTASINGDGQITNAGIGDVIEIIVSYNEKALGSVRIKIIQ